MHYLLEPNLSVIRRLEKLGILRYSNLNQSFREECNVSNTNWLNRDDFPANSEFIAKPISSVDYTHCPRVVVREWSPGGKAVDVFISGEGAWLDAESFSKYWQLVDRL